MRLSTSLVTSLVFSLSLLACADTGPYYVSDAPPPPPQEEVVGVAPYPGAVRINGYWGWEGGRHTWHPGGWERPRPGYVWAPHRWEQRGNRYVFYRGGWRRH